jgi:hypothetical protein
MVLSIGYDDFCRVNQSQSVMLMPLILQDDFSLPSNQEYLDRDVTLLQDNCRTFTWQSSNHGDGAVIVV